VGFDDWNNEMSLNSKGAISPFSIASESQNEIRMIRLRQIEKIALAMILSTRVGLNFHSSERTETIDIDLTLL
jgi:hypothetical protein